MHHRISSPGTFVGMKPFELVRGLMLQADLGPLPLAKKLNKPQLQPQIHRFINGDVAEPRRATALPIAEFFGIPVEALYDEKIATKIARERDIPDPPPVPLKRRRKAESIDPHAVAQKAIADPKFLQRVNELIKAAAGAASVETLVGQADLVKRPKGRGLSVTPVEGASAEAVRPDPVATQKPSTKAHSDA